MAPTSESYHGRGSATGFQREQILTCTYMYLHVLTCTLLIAGFQREQASTEKLLRLQA